jgi:CHASE2 domain-containing sensor protein
MVLLKLKKGAFIKKIIKKISFFKSENDKITNKNILKRFSLHLIFIFFFSLLFLPVSKLDGINPITHTFKDLAFSDIYFSKIRKNTYSDTATGLIKIINIGRKDKSTTRNEITKFLNAVNNGKFKPKVIGIDVMFESYTDSITDLELSKSLNQNNIVLVNKIEKITANVFTSISSLNKFQTKYSGYSNQWIEKDKPLTERYFKPRFKLSNSDIVEHFSLKVAQVYNNSSFKKFSTKNLDFPRLINYRGDYSVNNRFDINDTNSYKEFKNKIVLIGLYEFDENGKPLFNEDLHWSPTNERYFGRSAQNIYGIEIQANIISNIVNNDFIIHSKNINLLIQIVFSIIIYFLLLKNFLRNKLRFTLSKLFLQIFTVGFLILLSLFQIMWFNIYNDYTILIIVAFLSTEVLGIIEAIIDKCLLMAKKLFIEPNKDVQNDTKL